MRTRNLISTITGIRALVLALALGAAGFATPEKVQASYPGSHNGRLIFGINLQGNMDVYSVLPNGHDLRRLTPTWRSTPVRHRPPTAGASPSAATAPGHSKSGRCRRTAPGSSR